jgi:hypothetical protein
MSLRRKYLAYIALLAGWLVFCYWLYAKEIYPRLHKAQGTPWPVFDKELMMPLAFTWGSDIPHAGKGFEEWIRNIHIADSSGQILVLKGYYFRDEMNSLEKGKVLARQRVDRMIEYLALNRERVILEILPGEIISDVRSRPFKAFDVEAFPSESIIRCTLDTMEVCFPIKDSVSLPSLVSDTVDGWIEQHSAGKGDTAFLVGIADATGIAESADMAWDRAVSIKERFLANGWNEDLIRISTGQRNLGQYVKNRCVIVYFE